VVLLSLVGFMVSFLPHGGPSMPRGSTIAVKHLDQATPDPSCLPSDDIKAQQLAFVRQYGMNFNIGSSGIGYYSLQLPTASPEQIYIRFAPSPGDGSYYCGFTIGSIGTDGKTIPRIDSPQVHYITPDGKPAYLPTPGHWCLGSQQPPVIRTDPASGLPDVTLTCTSIPK
jgi:hypothetical protein